MKASHRLCLQGGGSCVLQDFLSPSFLEYGWLGAAGYTSVPDSTGSRGRVKCCSRANSGRSKEELWQLRTEVRGNAQCVHASRIDHACSCGKLHNDALEQGFLWR